MCIRDSYPVAIVLIALSFFQRWLAGRRWVYPVAVLFTGVFRCV